MKTLLITLFLLFFSFHQTTTYVSVKYDKFKDQTVVSIQEMPLGKGAGSSTKLKTQLDLTVSHIYKGQHAPRLNPDDRLFLVLSSNELLTFSTPPSLILMVDGNRLDLHSDVLMDIPGLGNHRQAKIPMTVGLFRKICSAKIVEGQFDDIIEFHLTANNIREMKTFLSKLNYRPSVATVSLVTPPFR